MGLSWVLAHWKPIVGALALAAAFAAGWMVRGTPPQPNVALKQDTAVQRAAAAQVEVREVAGPVKIVTETVTKYRECTITPGVRQGSTWTPSPAETITTTTETRGVVTTDTKASEQSEEKLAQHVDLKVTPAPAPGWAVQLGLEDVTGQRVLRAAVRRRLLGQVWLEGSYTPARGEVGAALAFHF